MTRCVACAAAGTTVCTACAKVAEQGEPVYGMCTACGAVEVALNRVTGTRNLAAVGESAAYPTGYGCEVCA